MSSHCMTLWLIISDDTQDRIQPPSLTSREMKVAMQWICNRETKQILATLSSPQSSMPGMKTLYLKAPYVFRQIWLPFS